MNRRTTVIAVAMGGLLGACLAICAASVFAAWPQWFAALLAGTWSGACIGHQLAWVRSGGQPEPVQTFMIAVLFPALLLWAPLG